ncbi:MAG: YceH family protein [Terracidiphilus sp.]
MPPESPIKLTPAQARVLGALIEKEVTTPEYYPLSMNALLNASNQRSNREPVMTLDEDDARLALRGLEDLRLAGRARTADGRVTKYEHWLGEAFNLSRAETALLCVLLLRGPQTPGELRGRTERMHSFEEIADVLAGLEKLMERELPLAAVLPRMHGTKEARYAHLLSAQVEPSAATPAQPLSAGNAYQTTDAYQPGEASVQEERIARLESAVHELRQQMAELSKKFDDLFA